MLNRQRINAVEYEIKLIDEELVALAADGYMADVDRKLDERLEQQLRRERLRRGEPANG
jgi:hypothetical protein